MSSITFSGGTFTEPGSLLSLATVVRAEYVTPLMRRVTLTSDSYAELHEILPSQFVRLYLPPTGTTEVVLPSTEEEIGSDYEVKTSRSRISRPYTVRSFDRAKRELAVDFVVHPEPGPGSTWGVKASVGDRIGTLITPTHPWTNPPLAVIDEQRADWLLLIGEETSLPQMIPLLKYLPANARAIVFIEVENAAEEQPYETDAQVELTWLHRNGIPAGTSGLLERAVREMPWPEGRVYAWVVGEIKEVVGIRNYLRKERGLDHHSYTIAGYWRRGIDQSTRAVGLFKQVADLETSGLAPQEVFDLYHDIEP